MERNLQLAVEAFTDMGSHIIVDENLGSFERARDVPDLFQKHGRIGEKARDTWQSMIGFRDVLVHEYVDIERRRVYDTLQYHLDDIRQLSHAFDRFLE